MRTGTSLLVLLTLMACVPGSEGGDRSETAQARAHWAFQPVRPAAPPPVRTGGWCRNPVDQFLLAAMESHGLAPAPPARPEQLVRRLCYDLTGLPPTPDELDDFLRSAAADKYERLVDRLLSSPHYGERWARHWLDLARYAESDGFEHDAVRPASWRYRDYVVAAFEQDKPYDRFLQEQIAGDELWPEQPVALVATGFNLLGPDMVDSADQIQRRLNTLNDITDTTASVVLGLTLGCARCHDHKFDPITQQDYFRMQAFFAPADFRREHPVPTAGERSLHEQAMAAYNQRTSRERRAITELEAPYRERLFEQKLAQLSEDAQLAHRTLRERRTKEQEGTVQETALMVTVTDADVEHALTGADRPRRKELLAQLARVPKPAPLPYALALQNTNGAAPPTLVLARGDYNNPREEVAPGFPRVLPGGDDAPESGPGARRTALARWLSNPGNPLTARVMVNRIWQHHFGRGLVATPSDFGSRGSPPSHPELLDWLAGEFIRAGWSIKAMHRLILTSAAYRQSSVAPPGTLGGDPENRWLARQSRCRLEGEAIRDSLLAISGRLNDSQGGPSVLPPIPADLARTARSWSPSASPADHTRRSIYIFNRRNLRFPFLEVFDAPDSNQTCPERGRSTTAPQALTLLNASEVMEAAAATARRLAAHSSSPPRQVAFGHRLILGREPTPAEQRMAEEFVRESEQRAAGERAGASGAAHDIALTELCRAWFNLSEFVYAE